MFHLAQDAHDLLMEREDLVPQAAVLFRLGEQALTEQFSLLHGKVQLYSGWVQLNAHLKPPGCGTKHLLALILACLVGNGTGAVHTHKQPTILLLPLAHARRCKGSDAPLCPLVGENRDLDATG